MNKKKIIVFHFNNTKQIYGEFHENVKIKMLKTFIKDVSHMSNVHLLYNDKECNDDNMSVKEILKGRKDLKLLLRVLEHDEDVQMISNQTISSMNFCISSPDLGKESHEIEERKTLETEIKRLQQEKQVLADNISQLNLKRPCNDKEWKINTLNTVEVISIKQRKESNTNYSKDKQINVSSFKRKSSVDPKMQIRKSTLNIKKKLSSSIKRISFPDKLNSVEESPSPKIVNGGYQSYSNQKEIHECGLDLIKQVNSMIVIEVPKMSDRKSLWNVIIPNLTKADQLSLSLVNKDNRRKVLCYWFDLVTMQVDNIERVINHSIDVYENLVKEYPFQIHYSTNTALKILNGAKHKETFNLANEHFMNNSILPIYKILFQIIRQYDTIQDDKEFVSQMKIFFLDKSKIGDYLRSTVSQCDFSFKNVTLIKKLCKVYRISSIDSGWIGKLCQTTGIVSFLIRDCLKYCGLVDEVEKRNKETSSSFPGKTILKGLFQFQKMRKRKEKILRRLEVTINNTSS